jgi:hypothetical protein
LYILSLQDICFTKLDTEGVTGKGLLAAIESLLTLVYLPSCRALDKGWENLDSPEGLPIRNAFFNAMENFHSVLTGEIRIFPYDLTSFGFLFFLLFLLLLLLR